MWIFRAMRVRCGRIREVLLKHLSIRLPMGATWRLAAGLRTETCGCSKTFYKSAELFLRPTFQQHFLLSLKLKLDLQLNHSRSHIASETSTQNASGWLFEK